VLKELSTPHTKWSISTGASHVKLAGTAPHCKFIRVHGLPIEVLDHSGKLSQLVAYFRKHSPFTCSRKTHECVQTKHLTQITRVEGW
jgi:hypothetical protein